MTTPSSDTVDGLAIPSSPLRLYRLLGAALIIVLTTAAYLPTVHNGFIWDDDDYVTENPVLRDVAGLRAIWTKPGAIPQYYPLVHTTFWLEYQLWGARPLGYHIVNTVLHILTALLIWRVLAQLRLPGAWFAAAIFAIHPVNVESVAWVTERKNVLAGCLFFASLSVYLRWLKIRDTDPQRVALAHWILALSLYLAALFSKTITCSLPAVILVLVWWKKPRVKLFHIGPLLPFFGVGLVMAWVTVRLEKIGVGATGAEWSFTLIERGLIAGRAVFFYAGKALFPHHLVFIYERWRIDATSAVQYIYPLGLLIIALVLVVFRRRWGRGPFAALLLFCGTLFPALGFIDVYPMRYSFVADHFQYLSIVVPIACFVAGVVTLGGHLQQSKGCSVGHSSYGRRLMHGSASVLLIGLALLSWQRCHAFQNEETLWLDTLRRNPTAWIAHNNLGLSYFHQNRLDDAQSHFLAALSLKPDHANAATNLALVCERLGQVDAAQQHFQHAISVASRDGRITSLYAAFLARHGQDDMAAILFQRAVEQMPSSALAWLNLSVFYANKQDFSAALSAAERALHLAKRKGHDQIVTMAEERLKTWRNAVESSP